MKKFMSFFVMMLLLPSIGRAATFTQNEFTTAESLEQGMTQSGVHFTLGKDYKSYYPSVRYGLGAFFEVGLKFGFTSVNLRPGDEVAVLVGPDLKYQLVKETEGIPVDMAVDLGYDNTFIKGKNVSELTFSTIFSRSYPLTDRGYKFTPYGGLEMAARYGSYVGESETNFYIFGGLEWKITQKFLFMLELKAGESSLGGAGIRFEY